MQKRDKFGRFLKKNLSKKKDKKATKGKIHKQVIFEELCHKPKKVTVHVTKKGHLRPRVRDLSFFDLQDMIQAEVAFQMKESW